jgi:hypothetical protein
VTYDEEPYDDSTKSKGKEGDKLGKHCVESSENVEAADDGDRPENLLTINTSLFQRKAPHVTYEEEEIEDKVEHCWM